MGLEGAQEGKGVAGKSHRGSSVNKRHPIQDLGVAAKSSQGRFNRPPLGEGGTNTLSEIHSVVLRN